MKGKILVMDDEEVVREVAAAMLKRLGYEVGLVRDGSEAVEAYRAARSAGAPFDAVIMDLTVPGGVGGEEALKRLRALDPSVKAIVSSGYTDDPIVARYEDYGFVGVIAKPYKVNDLSDAVAKALSS